MLYKIIYSSEQTRPISKEDLVEIISKSKRNNQRDHITGCLLFHEPYFAQVLEGVSSDLMNLVSRLNSDPRHKNMKISQMIAINKRVFGDWYMSLASENPLSTQFLMANLGTELFNPSQINDEELFDLIKKIKCG